MTRHLPHAALRASLARGVLPSTVTLLALFALLACSGGATVADGSDGSGGNDAGTGGSAGNPGFDPGDDPDDPEEPGGPKCGDGVLDDDELCDDGNTKGGDGCSANCKTQNENYDCSTPGIPCIPLSVCGDGALEGNELCDDGNTKSGDGCSANCQTLEDGWACVRPGTDCTLIPVCGNGVRERGEECDSSDSGMSDPGCIECEIQDGYWCLTPGQPCIEDACPNGKRTPNEQCDLGPEGVGNGCSASCTVEPGFRCNSAGCFPDCGDGQIRGNEQCDDGNTDDGDGCNAACRLEPGHVCTTPPNSTCTETECGNGIPEPGEGCDDGNEIAGDGCGPTCQNEPTFDSDGVAQLTCGDGLITGDEACDDGNTSNGDGCSSVCTIEPGFECDDLVTYPSSVRLSVTYRDFRARAAAGGHPDFQWQSNPTRKGIPGPVCTTANNTPCASAPGATCPANTCGVLDADGKPVFHLTGDSSERGRITNASTYALWYRNTNSGNVMDNAGTTPIALETFEESLVLDRVGGATSDVYRYDSSAHFPLNGRGFGDTCDEVSPDCCNSGGVCRDRNYHFTTELRYFFQYQGGETLTFRGDDDVWVFVNGRLAVDIGGVHGAQWGRVVLGDDGSGGATDSNCSVHGTGSEPSACTLEASEVSSDTDNRFGLVRGGVYQIVLFHAERHTEASNFRLTLSGFLAPRSHCTPRCGDGVVTGWEVCDDGASNADGQYGVCNATCSGKEYCGDGLRQEDHEECDNGFNQSLYEDGTDGACAPGCVPPPYCGDSRVEPGFELCDEGPNNDDTAYDGCTTECTWGPFCGDGTQDPEETCDNGFGPGGNVAYAAEPGACGYDCEPAPYCGDGIRNGPEQCDLGVDNNVGGYGGCLANCTRAPHCGDKVVQKNAGEECDDGPTGSLTCTSACKQRVSVR